MSFTVAQVKEHLVGMAHGSTLNKVKNQYALFERAASKLLLKMHPTESIRTRPLSSVVHDDVYNYALYNDFGQLIDLYPQADRQKWDIAYRKRSGEFDLLKVQQDKTVSIESHEGTKIIRINWRTRTPKVLHRMNDVDDNGTWVAVSGATNIEQDKITKYTGLGSVRFDLASTGDGIRNSTMSSVDLSNEDEVADVFFRFYLKDSTDVGNFNSWTGIWGNDLSSNLWTGVAQTTQFDGSAWGVGWNLVKIPWSTATETGTVTPSSIDSFKLTANIDAAISDIRVDNIVFSIGKAFDIKYYSKFLFINSSGTWISQPTTDDDIVVLDNDSLPHYLYECLIEIAQQMEGTDSSFDIQYAKNELAELYPIYKAINPSNVKKTRTRYGSSPGARRWSGSKLWRS